MRLTIIAALVFGFSLVALPDRASAFAGCTVEDLGWGMGQNVCWTIRDGEYQFFRGLPFYWYANAGFAL